MAITGLTEFHMNEWVCGNDSLDYSKTLSEGAGILLDCTLGVNPNEFPEAVYRVLHAFDGPEALGGDAHCQDIIKKYPHGDAEVCAAIADRLGERLQAAVGQGADPYAPGWAGVPFIPEERNILLGCGSLDLLFNLNLLCLTRGQKVLGHAPQFNVYVDNVRFGGSVYECYCMRREAGNFLFEADRYIEQMREEHRLFIVENPNNPTGQVIPLADIARIAARARALGRILVVDEAYGTYMGMDNSAIRLLGSYPNVVVTRTFSKGMGMAGMRMGYCVGGSDKYGGGASGEDSVLFQLSKLVNSFACNGLARALALAMLRTDPASLDSYLALGQIAHNKRALRQIFEGGSDGMGGSGSDGSSSGGSGLRRLRALRMAATSDETPILTVYVDEPSAAMRADAGWSLQSFLAQSVGLGTVSCATYLGLDRFAIRIMLPSDAGQVALLSDMLARADEMLAEGALS